MTKTKSNKTSKNIKKKFKAKTKSTNMTITQVIDFTTAGADQSVIQNYSDIAGIDRPLDDLVSSNVSHLQDFSIDIMKEVCEYLLANQCEIAVKTRRLGVTPASKPVIDVSAARKSASLPKKARINMIAGIHIYPVPSDDPGGFAIAVDLVQLLFGPDARAEMSRMAFKARRGRVSAMSEHQLEWLDQSDPAKLQAAIDKLIRPTFSLTTREERDAFLLVPDGWSRGRPERGLMVLAILSMLPVLKKLVSAGAGKPILTAALARLEHDLKLARVSRPCTVHRDGVPHFWAAELKRLGLSHLNVPLVKLR